MAEQQTAVRPHDVFQQVTYLPGYGPVMRGIEDDSRFSSWFICVIAGLAAVPDIVVHLERMAVSFVADSPAGLCCAALIVLLREINNTEEPLLYPVSNYRPLAGLRTRFCERYFRDAWLHSSPWRLMSQMTRLFNNWAGASMVFGRFLHRHSQDLADLLAYPPVRPGDDGSGAAAAAVHNDWRDVPAPDAFVIDVDPDILLRVSMLSGIPCWFDGNTTHRYSVVAIVQASYDRRPCHLPDYVVHRRSAMGSWWTADNDIVRLVAPNDNAMVREISREQTTGSGWCVAMIVLAEQFALSAHHIRCDWLRRVRVEDERDDNTLNLINNNQSTNVVHCGPISSNSTTINISGGGNNTFYFGAGALSGRRCNRTVINVVNNGGGSNTIHFAGRNNNDNRNSNRNNGSVSPWLRGWADGSSSSSSSSDQDESSSGKARDGGSTESACYSVKQERLDDEQ